jgi:hypothetical protein
VGRKPILARRRLLLTRPLESGRAPVSAEPVAKIRLLWECSLVAARRVR